MSERASHTPASAKLPRPPRWLIYTAIVVVVASWVPLGLIAVARTSHSPNPRIHIIQDMDFTPAYKAQEASPLFQDRRAMRPPVPGTVAQGLLHADDFFNRGYATDPATGKPIVIKAADGSETKKYFEGYPEQVQITRQLLERGRERYNIHCAVCHGTAGYGDGMVHRRVVQINTAALSTNQKPPAADWVQPRNLHDDRIRASSPAYLFDIITNGINKMAPYASQVAVADRWAIVAYVQALQLSQNYAADQLPAGTVPIELISAPAQAPAPAAPAAAPAPAPAPVATPAPAPAPAPAETPAPAEGGDDAALIAKGKELFQTRICMTCHATPENPAAPPLGPSFLNGIVGRKHKVTIGPGGPEQEITVDKAYFVESILQPMAKITINEQTGQAYPPIMVVVPPPPTEAEIDALWAYIKSIPVK
jgi:mono/diheme cytochrome c family protein